MSSPRSDPEQLLGLACAGDDSARGKLFELYHGYLELLARLQIGRRLQGKVDPADLVQETFLQAQVHFPQFQGSNEAELVSWLRHILASRLEKLIRHYCGTQRRDLRLERQLASELEQSTRLLDQGLVAPDTTSPASAPCGASRRYCWPRRCGSCPTIIARC